MRKNLFPWRKALELATEVIPKLPSSGDGTLKVLVKLLGVADSVQKHFLGGSMPLDGHFERLGASPKTNAHFVDLFFSTPLRDRFRLQRRSFTDHVSVVQASGVEGGSLYFVEKQYTGCRPYLDPDFWYSDSFNFPSLLSALWDSFDGRIHVSLLYDPREYRSRSIYTPIPAIQDPLLGGGKERLEEFVRAHETYVSGSIPRTYLFVGPPGGGKTTFALRAAERLGGRALRIEASGLTRAIVQDLDFLIENLCPPVVIVDDLDRAKELEESLPAVFSVLSEFKGKHPETTVILTVNDLTKLDTALIRPGRVDEILYFNPPERAERRDLLEGYLKEFNFSGDLNLEEFVAETEGLTGAYLREIALQCRHKGPAKALALAKDMKVILKIDKDPPRAVPAAVLS